jgi:actin-like ATPase involved in cell morphogenesis
MIPYSLAVDFGTSNTTAAIGVGDKSEVLEFGRSRYLPSVVLLDDEGVLIVGKRAVQQAALFPANVAWSPKESVGRPALLLGGSGRAVVIEVPDAIAAVYRAVAREAARQFDGQPASQVILTHPAAWGQGRLNVLREAATRVGWKDILFVPEPVAAAMHYGRAETAPEMVAVYDLGGGTFDTAVLRRRASEYEIAGRPGGDPNLGGNDFDERLRELTEDHARRIDEGAWASFAAMGPRDSATFAEDIRQAKEALSDDLVTAVPMPGGGFPQGVRVTRREFEGLIEPDVRRSVALLEETIFDAEAQREEIGSIYLTGGSSRIPLVSRLIHEGFERVPTTQDDPKTVVVKGALQLPRPAELEAVEEQKRIAHEERTRKAREDEGRKAREDEERKAREDEERKARKDEEERKAREDEERKARKDEERKARKDEEERKARTESVAGWDLVVLSAGANPKAVARAIQSVTSTNRTTGDMLRDQVSLVFSVTSVTPAKRARRILKSLPAAAVQDVGYGVAERMMLAVKAAGGKAKVRPRPDHTDTNRTNGSVDVNHVPPNGDTRQERMSSRRRGAIIVGVTVLFAVGVAAAFVIPHVLDHHQSRSLTNQLGGGSDSSDTGSLMSLAEIDLVERLPFTTSECRSDQNAISKWAIHPWAVVAGVVCSAGNGANWVQFWEFDGTSELYDEYYDDLKAFGIHRNSGVCKANSTVGESPYSIGGTPGGGRIACWSGRDGNAYIEWTHDDSVIGATAMRKDADLSRLIESWESGMWSLEA